MVRKRLFVLPIAVALLMVAAFAVGAASAKIAFVTPGRDIWYPSRADSINAADPSDYFQSRDVWYPTLGYPVSAADPSDYFQRHLDTLMSANAADFSDYFQRHTSADSLMSAANPSDWHTSAYRLMSAANPSDYYERHPEYIRFVEYYMNAAGR